MKYIIKNKIFSWGAGSTVKDEAGGDLYTVKGSVFTFTKKKSVCDMKGNELFIVRNKFLFFLLPKVYICDGTGRELIMLKKHNAFSFRASFDMVPLDGVDWEYAVDGDFIGRHYDILDHGQPIAHVRRNFNLIKDSFCLETEREDLAPLLIAFVIGIDNFFDKLQNDYR